MKNAQDKNNATGNTDFIRMLDDMIKKHGAESVISDLKQMLESKEITGDDYEKILSIASHLTFERLAPATKEVLMNAVPELKEKHDRFMELVA